jgi:hypothetical protein
LADRVSEHFTYSLCILTPFIASKNCRLRRLAKELRCQ